MNTKKLSKLSVFLFRAPKQLELIWGQFEMKTKKETAKIVSNEAVRGKPYLDIDRVLIEGKTKNKME